MAEHIVRAYDAELKDLKLKISEMGGRVERMVVESVQALSRLDVAMANEIVMRDSEIDNFQREIDEVAILTIAKRQPMANDLRVIIAAIRTSNDLERIGDLAKNIARRVIAIDGRPVSNTRIFHGIEHMADLAAVQLKNVLDAFSNENPDLARAVHARDNEVDELHTSLFRELLTYMMEDPRNITFCTHLLFCAKNIERIGDHATNIAETIVYVATGQPMLDGRQQVSSSVVSLDATDARSGFVKPKATSDDT